MSDETGMQRRILTQISPIAWEHPADRAALNALRKIPGFDLGRFLLTGAAEGQECEDDCSPKEMRLFHDRYHLRCP